jgi:hypothetical protein
MKFSSSSKQILQNPFVLYFVLTIALGDLLYLSVSGNFVFVAIFMLIGFLSTFFSKNMVVILVIAMAATSIIQFGAHSAISEGMEDEKEEEEEKEGMEGDEEEKEGMEGDEEEEEPFTDKPEAAKEETKPKKEEAVIDKVISDQKDLVDKVKQLEPMMKEIESFVDRINKFSEYTSSK